MSDGSSFQGTWPGDGKGFVSYMKLSTWNDGSCHVHWTEGGCHHSAGRVLTDIVEQYHGKCQTLKYKVWTEFCSTVAASGAASKGVVHASGQKHHIEAWQLRLALAEDRGTCVNSLPRDATCKWNGHELHPQPLSRQFDAQTITVSMHCAPLTLCYVIVWCMQTVFPAHPLSWVTCVIKNI